MKILVIINSLDSGGAEKSALKLASGLHGDGHEVVFLTFTSDYDFYKPLSDYTRLTLDSKNETHCSVLPERIILRRVFFWTDQMKRLFRLRRLAKEIEPHCIISISANVAVFTFISTIFLKIPQVGSERINPDKKIFSHGKIADLMRPFIYRHGVYLSVQTRGIQQWCLTNWNCESIVTPNHLSQSPSRQNLEIELEREAQVSNGCVLAVGRDHPQKNFDFLLRAWKQYESIGGSRELFIVGPSNPKRLEMEIARLEIEHAKVVTRTLNLAPFYNSADLLVSTSHFEGFPNVILEALSFSIPVISTPSCDLIHEFEFRGCCIVANSSSEFDFATLIKNTLGNKTLMERMSQSAWDVSLSYTWEGVRDSWYRCIDNAIAGLPK